MNIKKVLLDKGLLEDVEKSFKRLINKMSYENVTDGILSNAQSYLQEQFNGKDEINKLGFKNGAKLIDLIQQSSNKTHKMIGFAALEYLLDPWDIIPDFVGSEGLIDDIYVMQRAIQIIESGHSVDIENDLQHATTDIPSSSSPDWLLDRLGGASGPHFAKRMKELNILSNYERKAVFDIGQKQLYGSNISIKQYTFFETLIEKSIQEGLLHSDCPITSCQYCSKLKKIYRTTPA